MHLPHLREGTQKGDRMNDNPLYDLLAKAELHPNNLTPIERLIWWIHETNNDNGCNNDILIASATELEQLQQNSEAERDTVWLGEPVPAPEVTG